MWRDIGRQHFFGIGEVFNNALTVIIKDTVQKDGFKGIQCDTGILSIIVCAALLIIRFNDSFTLKCWLVQALYEIKELLNGAFQFRAIGREIHDFHAQLCDLLKIRRFVFTAHIRYQCGGELIAIPIA